LERKARSVCWVNEKGARTWNGKQGYRNLRAENRSFSKKVIKHVIARNEAIFA